MKITKAKLRQIIQEELQQEGLMDTVAGKLGYEKKGVPRSQKINAVRRMFLNIGRDDDELDKAIDALHALGIADEVGEEGSLEKKLWDAASGIYAAFNKVNDLLSNALEDASTREYAEMAKRGKG